jgi:hypothetical protein
VPDALAVIAKTTLKKSELELVGLGRGIFNTNPIICFRIN